MLTFAIVINYIYVFLIIYLFLGIYKLGIRKNKVSSKKNKVSVIVAARNEEKNITTLLNSLEKQSYSKDLFEVIVVDDRSNDKTSTLITEYIENSKLNLKLLNVYSSKEATGKKHAVSKGIDQAKHEILLFTDSDCIVNSKWVETMANQFDDDTDYVLGYTHVKFKHKTFLNNLKTFEAIVYRALAASGIGNRTPITASASNMAYRKSIYYKADGFGKFKHVPSGDDDLQLFNLWEHMKVVKYLFLNGSKVCTIEKESVQAHANLETRRASKFKYHPRVLQLFSVFMFLYFISFGFLIYEQIINFDFWKTFVVILGLKISVELLFLGSFINKVKEKKYLKYYFAFTIVYIFIFIVFSIKGTLGKYKWKN